jgi:hypothetical protein
MRFEATTKAREYVGINKDPNGEDDIINAE